MLRLGLQPSRARAQRDKKLVELLELLGKCTCTFGGDGGVERFLRGIEVVHDDLCLAASFFEGHRGDGAVRALVIAPGEARRWCHLEVLAEERYGFRVPGKHQSVPTPDTNIHLAGKQGQAN